MKISHYEVTTEEEPCQKAACKDKGPFSKAYASQCKKEAS